MSTLQPCQPTGLGIILDWGDGGGAVGRDKLIFAAVAASAVASPLTAIMYRGKSISTLSRAATVAAAPLVSLAFQPTSLADSAVASQAPTTEGSKLTQQALPELKPVWGLYHPWNLSKMLVKNLALQFLLRFNKYMSEQLAHEQAAIEAEAKGLEPPQAPDMPDMLPAMDRGLTTFARELSVTTTRRIYEHIAAARLPAHRAQALLRDSKSWIRDVLSVKHSSSSLSRRFVAYQFATLHSSALYHAADCTVAVAQHTFRTLKRRPGKRLEFWARGVALQVLRCSMVLLAASVGSALGSLVKPGVGTQVGHMACEFSTAFAMAYVVESLLE